MEVWDVGRTGFDGLPFGVLECQAMSGFGFESLHVGFMMTAGCRTMRAVGGRSQEFYVVGSVVYHSGCLWWVQVDLINWPTVAVS